MAEVQPASVRAAIADRVRSRVADLGRVSEEPYEFIRAASHSPVHGEFAVGVPSSEPVAGRQRPADGVLTRTEVRVLWPWQTTKDRVAGFAAGLGVEGAVRNALVAQGWTEDFQVLWVRSERAAGADGWFWFESAFHALHLMPLE